MAKRHKEFLLKVTGIQCPHWCTVAFWTIGITIMTVMTIRDLRPIVSDYMDDDENVQIEINVKRGDDSSEAAKRPDLYFCMPLVAGWDYKDNFTEFCAKIHDHVKLGEPCPLCELMANNSWDFWNRNGNLSLLKGINNTDEESQQLLEETLSIQIIENFLDTGLSKSQIITWANLDWIRPVFSVLVMEMYSAHMEVQEYYDSFHNSLARTKYTNFNDGRMDRLYSILVKTVCELAINFIPSGDLAQGRVIPGDECARLIHDSSSLNFNYINDFNEMRFCFKLPIDSDHFAMRLELMYFAYLNTKREMRIFNENPAYAKGEETLEPVLISTSRDLDQFDNEIFTAVYSLHTNVVEDRPTKLRTCYEDSSRSECSWKCRTEQLESTCDCQLFTKRKHLDLGKAHVGVNSSSSSRYCEKSQLETCIQELIERRNSTDGQAVFDCGADKCVDACESSSYQFQSNAQLGLGSVLNWDGSVFNLQVIRRQQEPYLEFVRKVRDSSQELVSKVGGVVNFYLGLSWLSIILFMIYLFDTWRRYRELSSGKGAGHWTDRPGQAQAQETAASDSAASPASAAWRWRWTQLMTMANNPENQAKKDVPELGDLERRLQESEERGAKIEQKMDGVLEKVGEMDRRLSDMDAVIRNIERMLAAKRE